MISKNTLQKAAQHNIIKTEQVEPLYQFIQDQNSGSLPVGSGEPIKYGRSFGDVFITLGVILLVMAINMADLPGTYYIACVAGFVGLAEWLVRVRRLALPGMAILLSILYFVYKVITIEYGYTVLISLGLLSTTSLLFYLRYKMPFSLFPLAAGLVAMALVQIGLDVLRSPLVFVSFGLVIFCIALWFDSRDTQRVSHLSDNAFWLYLLASPLMVHGAMIALLTNEEKLLFSVNTEVLMIVFFGCLFLLSLLIDRRSMLISTQLYVIYALSQLLQDKINNTQNVMIYTFIGLGLFVIYFGTYWYKSRRIIFGFLSGSFISRFIPDLSMQDIKQ